MAAIVRRSAGALAAVAALACAAPVAAVPADDAAIAERALRAGRLVQVRLMVERAPAAAAPRFAPIEARLLLAEGRTAEAAARLDALLAAAPDDCALRRDAGIAAGRLDRPERAITLLAATPCPPDPAARLALGDAYRATGRLAASEAVLRTAVAADADPAPGLRDALARTLAARGDCAGAATMLRAALRRQPGDAQLVDHLDQAEAACGLPLSSPMPASDPERCADRLVRAGTAAWRAGRAEAARAYLAAALVASPTFRDDAARLMAALAAVR